MPPNNFEPVSPIDLTANSKRSMSRNVGFADIHDLDEKSSIKPAIRQFPSRSNSTASSIISSSSLRPASSQPPRKARFAEATSVLSPSTDAGERISPFADPTMAEPNAASNAPKPSDVGFGYISDNQPVEQHATIRSDLNPGGAPLKSALKTPGTGARLLNPLSPTFREEVSLEKQEEKTEKEQAKDLKVKTRVRLAKMVLRGVNFSCSLIVLAMLSTVLTIFHATKALPPRNNMPAWAPNQKTWPQILILSIACVSLVFSVVVMVAYCRGGHRRAEKVAVYYTMFAVGWFMFSIIMWVIGAAVLQGTKSNGNGQDMWGWACRDNKRRQLFEDDVHYALVCRLQDWALICCIIEVVVEVIVIAIYGIVFYRFWSKNRLRKSMDARDKARTDLYLAQLRSQSAPNTPGFAQTPRTPGFPSHAKAYTAYTEAERAASPMQQMSSNASPSTSSPFKLQAPPIRVHHATPKAPSPEQFASVDDRSRSVSPPLVSPLPAEDRIHEHVAAAPGEQTYEAVPIPGAYSTPGRSGPGQAF